MENKEADNDFQQFERIEKFLLNELSDREKLEFLDELKHNESLKESVEQLRTMILAIEKNGMREKISQFHSHAIANKGIKDGMVDKPTFIIRRIIPFLVAASVVLLVGIGVFLMLTQPTKNEKIFSEFFEPDPGLITPMSADSDYLFYDGMINYKLREYEEAITQWEGLLNEFPQSDTLNYFLGVAHLALDNNDQAIRYLSNSLQITDNQFIQESRYYLGLAYLKAGKTEEAIRLFEKSEVAESKLILDRLNEE